MEPPRVNIGNIYQPCVDAVGGKERAEMLKTHIKRISQTKKLFIIEDYAHAPKINTVNDIRLCMQSLSV